MPGYLLLRNNKESGPHTLEEMIAKQLKQHDLIWIEGRSAAWRYPEEVDELRKYVTASVVADDIKPASINEKNQELAIKKPVTPEQSPYIPVSNQPKSEPTPVRDREAKYISVIFPNTVKPVVEKKQTDTPAVAAEKTPPVIKEKIIVEDEVAPSFSASSFSNKFPERKLGPSPKQDKSFNAAKNLIWGVAILMGGIVLGLSFDNFFKPKTDAQPLNETVAQQTVLPATQEEEPALNSSSAENSAAFVTKVAESEKSAEKPVKKKSVEKNIDASATDAGLLKKSNSTEENTTVATSIPVKNEAVNEEKERAKANIRHLLSVTNSKFKIGAFGGINELQISVTNNSHYPVDVVAVDVQYVLANKKVFKTETLYFRDLRPGVTLMQEAPKSSRGVKVEYSINAVNAKSLGL